MAIEVISTGLSPAVDHPMLWACFKSFLPRGTKEITPEQFSTHSASQQLPRPLYIFVQKLIECSLVTHIQTHCPDLIEPIPQSSICLAIQQSDAVTSYQQLINIIETAEALCHSRLTARMQATEARNAHAPHVETMGTQEQLVHQLHMRWQYALRQILARG